jgi:hypothetical protein
MRDATARHEASTHNPVWWPRTTAPAAAIHQGPADNSTAEAQRNLLRGSQPGSVASLLPGPLPARLASVGATAVVEQSAPRQGWAAMRAGQELLPGYRRHEQPAGAAHLLFVSAVAERTSDTKPLGADRPSILRCGRRARSGGAHSASARGPTDAANDVRGSGKPTVPARSSPESRSWLSSLIARASHLAARL